jgi:hypothetical protein
MFKADKPPRRPPSDTTRFPDVHRQPEPCTIDSRLGLHARPAMAFVDLANQFKSDILRPQGRAPEAVHRRRQEP